MSLVVNQRISLSELHDGDKPAMVAYLNDKDIYDRTLRIPYPYTEADADRWFDLVAKLTQEHGQPSHWAIRNEADQLFGAVGFQDLHLGRSHQAEIGYWLARPWWGQGIMTEVVRTACAFAFAEWGLVKITAHVFAHNPASARVLEKAGFQQEGFLRKHFLKDGRFIDAMLFALLKEEPA